MTDNDDIVSLGADPLQIIEKLRALTQATSATHTVHDFSDPQPGKAIVNLEHYQDADGNTSPYTKLWLHSPKPLQNGDTLLFSLHGVSVTAMVFDVERYDNPPDMYELHAVPFTPALEIGHDDKPFTRGMNF